MFVTKKGKSGVNSRMPLRWIVLAVVVVLYP